MAERQPAVGPALGARDHQRAVGGGPARALPAAGAKRGLDRGLPAFRRGRGIHPAHPGATGVEPRDNAGQPRRNLIGRHPRAQFRRVIGAQDQHVIGRQHGMEVVVVEDGIGQAVEVVQRPHSLGGFLVQAIAHFLRAGVRGHEDADMLALHHIGPVDGGGATAGLVIGHRRHVRHHETGGGRGQPAQFRPWAEMDGDRGGLAGGGGARTSMPASARRRWISRARSAGAEAGMSPVMAMVTVPSNRLKTGSTRPLSMAKPSSMKSRTTVALLRVTAAGAMAKAGLAAKASAGAAVSVPAGSGARALVTWASVVGTQALASASTATSESFRIFWQLDSCVCRDLRPRTGVPKARTNGDAPASPFARSLRWSCVHAARDANLRGRADEVPRRSVSGVHAGRTSPGSAWKGLPIPAPAGGTAEGRRMIPVAKAALAGLPMRDTRRGEGAPSGRHVRQWQGVMRAAFGTGITWV